MIENIVTIEESSPSKSNGEVTKAGQASYPSKRRMLNQIRSFGLIEVQVTLKMRRKKEEWMATTESARFDISMSPGH